MKGHDPLRNELVAALRGSRSHMSFEEVVADFPLQHINRKAAHMPYSTWQLVEHMRIAQWDILEFIRNPNHVSPEYPQGYRPRSDEKADESMWNETLRQFTADLKALEAMALDPDSDLLAPLPHAGDYTLLREILTAAAHNSYHIGEIALLRQLLDLWPPDNPYLTG